MVDAILPRVLVLTGVCQGKFQVNDISVVSLCAVLPHASTHICVRAHENILSSIKIQRK